MIKGWATLDGVKLLTRQEILDACDLLDALDEAAHDDRVEQERKDAQNPRRRPVGRRR